MAEIEYYWFPISPYSYLAGRKLDTIAARHGATITYRPFAMLQVFEKVGTPPVPQRHPFRQAYRLADIARVAAFEGLPVNLKPRYWPANPVPASVAVIAAQAAGDGDLGGLAHAIVRACWAEDRDVADDAVVTDLLAAHGFDPGLLDRALLSGVETYERNTTRALDLGVFGAPTYVVGTELFWGQDRLPHLDAHLAALA